MRMTLLLCFFVLSSIVTAVPVVQADTQKSKIFLEITNLENGGMVGWKPLVTGNVSTPFTEVWLIVHVLETSSYWVQPKATVRAIGHWEGLIFLGNEDMLDVGKEFELMAIANPRGPLTKGMQLPGWPRAEGKSNVITITRK